MLSRFTELYFINKFIPLCVFRTIYSAFQKNVGFLSSPDDELSSIAFLVDWFYFDHACFCTYPVPNDLVAASRFKRRTAPLKLVSIYTYAELENTLAVLFVI